MKIGKEFENAVIVYTENPKESTKLQKVVKYILGRSQDPSLTQKLSKLQWDFSLPHTWMAIIKWHNNCWWGCGKI